MTLKPTALADRRTFGAFDQSTRAVIGPANPRLLVIPIGDDGNKVIGGV
jgi:hypothetical protein